MNEKISLQDLVVLLSKKNGTTQKEADRFLRELFQLILDCIYEGDSVKIKDFGTFKIVEVSSRESIDVNTGEKIEIPAHRKMSFMPDKTLRNLVNEPFAQFESVILDDDLDLGDDDDSDEEGIDEMANVPVPEQDRAINIQTKTVEKDQTSIIKKQTEIIELKPRIKGEKLIEEKTRSIRANIDTVSKKEEISSSIEDVKGKTSDNIINKKEVVGEELDKKRLIDIVERKSSLIEDDDVSPVNIPIRQIRQSSASRTPLNETQRSVINTDRLPLEQQAIDEEEVLSNYRIEEQRAEHRRKWLRRLPVIIIAVTIMTFIVYKYAELFDVTYDYEYYLNRPKRFTMSDTLPLLDEAVQPVNQIDSSVVNMDVNDSVNKAKPEDVLSVKSNENDIRSIDILVSETPAEFDGIFVSK